MAIPWSMCVLSASDEIGVQLVKQCSDLIAFFYYVRCVPSQTTTTTPGDDDNDDERNNDEVLAQQMPPNSLVSFHESVESVFQTASPDVIVICNVGWQVAETTTEKYKQNIPVITLFVGESYYLQLVGGHSVVRTVTGIESSGHELRVLCNDIPFSVAEKIILKDDSQPPNEFTATVKSVDTGFVNVSLAEGTSIPEDVQIRVIRSSCDVPAPGSNFTILQQALLAYERMPANESYDKFFSLVPYEYHKFDKLLSRFYKGRQLSAKGLEKACTMSIECIDKVLEKKVVPQISGYINSANIFELAESDMDKEIHKLMADSEKAKKQLRNELESQRATLTATIQAKQRELDAANAKLNGEKGDKGDKGDKSKFEAAMTSLRARMATETRELKLKLARSEYDMRDCERQLFNTRLQLEQRKQLEERAWNGGQGSSQVQESNDSEEEISNQAQPSDQLERVKALLASKAFFPSNVVLFVHLVFMSATVVAQIVTAELRPGIWNVILPVVPFLQLSVLLFQQWRDNRTRTQIGRKSTNILTSVVLSVNNARYSMSGQAPLITRPPTPPLELIPPFGPFVPPSFSELDGV